MFWEKLERYQFMICERYQNYPKYSDTFLTSSYVIAPDNSWQSDASPICDQLNVTIFNVDLAVEFQTKPKLRSI